MKQLNGILVGSVLLFSGILHGQDPVQSHFYSSPKTVNPALSGVEGPMRIYVGYRNQWPNTGSSFVTYRAAYEQYVEALGGGIGVGVMNDRQGDNVVNAYALDASYAYFFRVNRKLALSGGLQAGVGQRSFNSGGLTFADMYNPLDGTFSGGTAEVTGYENRWYPDFAVGGAFFFQNYFGGLSVHHLLSPVITSETDPLGTISRRFTAHLGAQFSIRENRSGLEFMRLIPSLIFMQQGNTNQLNYGLDAIYREMLVGLWTRHDLGLNFGNLIFSVGYSAPGIQFKYSYDHKFSSPELRLPSMGAHELSLVFTYENLKKRKKLGTIIYPKI